MADADDCQPLVSIEVPVVWTYIRKVRSAIAEALAEHPRGLREAAQMVASELVENAVKYGESVPACENVRVVVAAERNGLSIAVSNGITDPARVEKLRVRIDRLRTPDSDALYMERIQQLLDDPTQDGKLGLFRIGAEGGFRLEMRAEKDVVTLIAKRDLT